MKFYCLLLIFLAAPYQSYCKSILPEGFTIEGLEGIDINKLLNDDHDESRQLSALTDRLKTMFQGAIKYVQNVPTYLSKVIRRPQSNAAAASSSGTSSSSSALTSAVENMMTSGSEVSPSIMDAPSNVNTLSNFFRTMASRVPWVNSLAGSGSPQQQALMKRIARFTRFLNYTKFLSRPLHRLSARNSLNKGEYVKGGYIKQVPVLVKAGKMQKFVNVPTYVAYPYYAKH